MKTETCGGGPSSDWTAGLRLGGRELRSTGAGGGGAKREALGSNDCRKELTQIRANLGAEDQVYVSEMDELEKFG